MDKKLFLKSKGAAPGTIIYEGDRPPSKTNITFYRITRDKVVEDNIIEYDNHSNSVIWIRITGLLNSEKIL